MSTPRAGSSLTQLCLNAHSRLFAPQELYLLAFANLRERRAALRDYALLLAGLGGAVGDLRRGDGRGLAAFWERGGAPTAAIYAALAEWAAPRCVVDKTPPNSCDARVLARAPAVFLRGRYLCVFRHDNKLRLQIKAARVVTAHC